MKKKTHVTFLLLSLMLMPVLCSCNGNNPPPEDIEYGSLKIADISDLKVGETRDLAPQFSVPEYAGEITYTFAGNDITINDNNVSAINANKTVAVTAKSKYHTATFTVKTIPENPEPPNTTLTIEDVNAWVGYPASEFFPKIEDENTTKTISFEYDNSKLSIDASNNTVQALIEGVHEVTASVEGMTTTFSVRSYTVNKSTGKFDTSNYDGYAGLLNQKWTGDKAGSNTSLFIGDSFFDTRYFWTNFYTTYTGKDALCFGISSTTSRDWEVYLNSWLGKLNPKNIIMHIGTNNVYDDNDSEEEAIHALQRLFTLMHGKMPDTNIYYFGISQRNDNSDKVGKVNNINAEMKSWCEQRSWITYLNTPEKLKTNMLKDGVHPKLEYYSIFTDELELTDILFESKSINLSIADIVRTPNQMIADAQKIMYNGTQLTTDYVLKGKIDITALENNAHLEFNFAYPGYNYRMLLWDNESKNKLKIGYAYNGAYDANAPQEAIYDFTAGQTLSVDFQLVSSDNNGYLYINNALVLVFVNATGTGVANSLVISTEKMGTKIYNMTAVSKEHSAQDYAAAIAPLQATFNLYSNKAAGAYRP